MTIPSSQNESSSTWASGPAGDDAQEQTSRLEVARRIAREALEADRQAVELDARFAFGVNSR